MRGWAWRRRGDGRRSEQAFATERVTHRRWGGATRTPPPKSPSPLGWGTVGRVGTDLTGCDFRPAFGLIGGSFVEAAVVR